MFQLLFERTVSALCYEIAGGPEERGEEAGAPYNDVARFVMRQHGNMPRLFRAGVQAGTVLFAVAAVARQGTVFHRLPPGRRRLQVEGWRLSRVGPCRDLMKFHSSLAVFALYSRPHAAGQGG